MTSQPRHRFTLLLLGICFLLSFSSLRISSFALAGRSGDTNPASGMSNSSPGRQDGFDEGGLRILESSAEKVLLELVPPDFQLDEGPAGLNCQTLRAAGYEVTGWPGWPQIPVYGASFGIPPNAQPQVTIRESDREVAVLDQPICPAPSYEVEFDPAGEIHVPEQVIRDAPEAMAAEGLFPEETVARDDFYLRSQRIAALQFAPFQYDLGSGELYVYRRLVIELSFNLTASLQPLEFGQVEEPAFETVFENMLLNYEQARKWRKLPGSTHEFDLPADHAASGATTWTQLPYKILVDQDGIYEVTYAGLEAAGVPVSTLDPRSLQLFLGNQEVAIYMPGGEDGVFDPTDSFLFYGKKAGGKYSDVNVYWLRWGITGGRRMGVRNGSPVQNGQVPAWFTVTQRDEKNKLYHAFTASGPDDEHWFWNHILATSPLAKTFPVSLNHIETSAYTATARGLLTSWMADPYHHTRVYLNGNLLEDTIWPAGTDHYFEVQIPSSYLLEGVNTFRVESPVDEGIQYDYLWVNWFEITYRDTFIAEGDQLAFTGRQGGPWQYRIEGFTSNALEVFDLSDPLVPVYISNPAVVVSGGSYRLVFEDTASQPRSYYAHAIGMRMAPKAIIANSDMNLEAPSNGADYIVISHADFYAEMQPLVNHRAGQGLRAMLVDAQEIYDEFSAGVESPQAIHDFLQYAYENWKPPAPAYVLLVGDGTYDPKNYNGYETRSFIHPYLAYVDPWLGETAADNRYVTVSGSDIFPDMHLGRLPVNTAAQAAAVVDKILSYELSPDPGNWNGRVFFVADESDSAGDFFALSETLAGNYLPVPYTATKMYYGVTVPSTDPAAARTAIVNGINQGHLLVNYIGHAAQQYWGMDSLFRLAELNLLTNADKLPVFLPMTCWEGYYIIPYPPDRDYSSMGERVLRAEGKGGIASWSPTGLGLATGHDFLSRGFFDAVYEDDVYHLGPATTLAKLNLYARTSSYRDLIDTYTLFGDPALNIHVLPVDLRISKAVQPAGSLTPGEPITYTLTFSNDGPATAHNVVIVDLLDSGLEDVELAYSGAGATPVADTHYKWNIVDLPAGSGGAITIRARIAPTATGTITNSARILTSGRDIQLEDNQTPPVLSEIVQPDLAISKQADPMVIRGSWITYTIGVTNLGTMSSGRTVITDVLPAGLVSPTFTTAGLPFVLQAGSQFVWEVDDIGPGQVGTIRLSAWLPPDLTGVVTNVASIMGENSEGQTLNNQAAAETLILNGVPPDLSISKTAQPAGPLIPGDAITYTLAFGNYGATTAEGVVVEDVLDARLQDVEIMYSGIAAAPVAGTRFLWNLANLEAGSEGAITIRARIAPTATGTISNSARIATETQEIYLDNNQTSFVVTQLGQPDLSVSKKAPQTLVSASWITYTLSVANLGTMPSGRAVITDVFPAELVSPTFTTIGLPFRLRAGSEFVWEVDNVDPWEVGTITLSAWMPPELSGMVVNTVTISSEHLDSQTFNDLAVAKTSVLSVYQKERLYLPLVNK